METGTWTTLTHTDTGASVRIGSLPGDINNDGMVDSADTGDLISHLRQEAVPPLDPWQYDIDRSGRCTPADFLRLIDLMNGADQYEIWNGASLP